MKICVITSSYPRYAGDGTGSFIASLARTLVDLGQEVHAVAPYDPHVTPMDQADVRVHRFRYAPSENLHIAGHGRALEADMRMRWTVPLLMPGFAAASIWQVIRLHRREHFDLIHGHWAVPGGFIAGLAARLTSLPLVISLHGSDVYVIENNSLYATAARAGFRAASRVTACSEDLRSRAIAIGLDEAKSIVIPYGVDLERYASGAGKKMREQLGIPQNALTIGALGRLVRKKGFRFLLMALPKVLETYPQTYCVIGGNGDLYNELKEQARTLDISDRVLFPGNINWRITPDYYAMCDLLIVPSVVDSYGNVDGLPNVLLEGMASSCAVVASNVAGIPSLIRDGQNGLLVPPRDPAALTEAILELLDNPDLRRSLGARAQEHMAESHNWSTIARRVLSVYTAAIKEHRR